MQSGCRRCHAQCEECSDDGVDCDVCKWYRTSRDECVSNCSTVLPASYLQPDNASLTERGRCLPCHAECRECDGPTHINCSRCENHRIYVKELMQYSDNNEQLLANYSVTVNDTVRSASESFY